jgi:hypothetical protein
MGIPQLIPHQFLGANNGDDPGVLDQELLHLELA